jgi:biotin carboxyl carrier protein
MIKIILLILTALILNANNIKISHATYSTFGDVISVNAKIIQLSNQKQQIVSRLGGHLEDYFVQVGDRIKRGDKIAKIESLELSRMTSSFISLKKELKLSQNRLFNAQKLYKKGLTSMQDVSLEKIRLSEIESKINTLKSQLSSLDIDISNLKTTTDSFIIYAHADGKIEKLLVNLHANLDSQTPIVSLVQESGYYAEAYMSVDEAMKISKDINAMLKMGDKNYTCKFISLLPQVDQITGQAKILFWIESDKDMLFLNAYALMQISYPRSKKLVVVKKNALSMFDGEWVVFVPHEEEHDEHEEEKDEEDGDHGEHKDHHEDEEEVPFSIKVVKKLQQYGDEVGVKGIEEGEEYVSDGVYFVKSMLLKSKLGGHGH